MTRVSLFVSAAVMVLVGPVAQGSAAGASVPDTATVAGSALFQQRCQGCHAVDPKAPAGIAPNLAGVVGRKSAATGFHYSDALKASGLTWTPTVLDTFLAGPMQLVPGTRMVVRVAAPADRAAIIAYLAHPAR